MPSKSKPQAPKHLKPETAAWYVEVLTDYQLEEHHRRLLLLAGESFDRGTAAREAIDKHGLTYTNRHGEERPRPEIAIERDARIAFARLLRELGLDVDGGPEEARPPRVAGYRKGA